ncbi:MAG TPA: type II toxin-antitoxin system prevent-host-death family antitoxin [Thermoanaerobaculia bacterium]|nr:type II toxin-antitoxin system prevent-host-death family antitoxin [Thermoanaerobaculia bacterium]
MRAVGAYEAKTHLSRLIDEVAHGERFAITKNGVPVAMLVPVPGARKTDPRKVIRQIRELRREVRLEGLSLREMIEEGRRS